MRTSSWSLTRTSASPLPLMVKSAARHCMLNVRRSPLPEILQLSSSALPLRNNSPDPEMVASISSASISTSMVPEPEIFMSISPITNVFSLMMSPEPEILSTERSGTVMKIFRSPMSRTQRSVSISQIPLSTSSSSSSMILPFPSTITSCTGP